MTIGARQLGISPRTAAILLAYCQRQDRRRRRTRLTIGGRRYHSHISGNRIELFGPAPKSVDRWRKP